MSATVESDEVFYGVCPECATGSTTYASEEDAQAWAATHDAENHADDDRSDEAYEQYRELRGER